MGYAKEDVPGMLIIKMRGERQADGTHAAPGWSGKYRERSSTLVQPEPNPYSKRQ